MTQTEFQIETHGAGLTEFTNRVRDWLGRDPRDGLLTLFVRHTS
ncbi:YjbQ family protein, partial [Cribrihabitans sp. XS_ASV171]